MFDLFAAAPKELRSARLNEYREFLVARDGEMDFKTRTLARREATIRKYEAAPASLRMMNEFEFRKQYASFDEKKELPEEMWMRSPSASSRSASMSVATSRTIECTWGPWISHRPDSFCR
jgi:hypothetical protein